VETVASEALGGPLGGLEAAVPEGMCPPPGDYTTAVLMFHFGRA